MRGKIDYRQIDVVDFLEELNIRNVRDMGIEVVFSCPFPGHSNNDSTPAASMEKGTTKAHCFGCDWRGNALTFLMDVENINSIEARHWILDRWRGGFHDTRETLAQEIDKMLEISADKKEILLDEYEADIRAERLVGPPLRYMLGRGFTLAIMRDFKLGYDAISDRISIPYRDSLGNLVGFKGRVWDNERKPKYLTLGGPEYGFEPVQVTNYLFGLDRAKLSALPMLVVEGELNALSMHQKEYTQTVGISGKHLSEKQVELIKGYTHKVGFIMDEVSDAIVAAKKLQRYMPTGVAPAHDEDPADMGINKLDELVTQLADSFGIMDLGQLA